MLKRHSVINGVLCGSRLLFMCPDTSLVGGSMVIDQKTVFLLPSPADSALAFALAHNTISYYRTSSSDWFSPNLISLVLIYSFFIQYISHSLRYIYYYNADCILLYYHCIIVTVFFFEGMLLEMDKCKLLGCLVGTNRGENVSRER